MTPLVSDIQRAVAAHYGVSLTDLLSNRRSLRVARPRQIGMYLARRLTFRSLPEIGRKFGNRDHSTVVHAINRIEALRGTDREIDDAVTSLTVSLDTDAKNALDQALTGWMA